jgi:PKD repeat protein
MADGSTRTCSTIPCQFSIDVGRRGQYLSTGWVKVEISNIPIGQSLTLTYGTGGSGDNAHGTWAYFDNVNTPPVARFTFDPTAPLEGEIVQFNDLSFDPDPGDAITSWQWNIDGKLSNEQNPTYISPNEGAPCLTVADMGGAKDSVTGATATDGADTA